MQFILTDGLKQDVVNALENQEKKFLVSAEKCILVEKTDSVSVDDDLYYELPEWTSESGFDLRKQFVNELHSPIVQEELQEVLHSGRGVFRNFKIVLKKYPEIEKKWHVYKNRYFSMFINDWYNELRELWGLEKLDQMPESDEELVYDDFSFSNYNSLADGKELPIYVNAIIKDDCQNYAEELSTAIYEMWNKQFSCAENTEQTGFICRSLSDDFAGCILVNPVSEKQNNVMVVSSFFVLEKFRGLGIGSELLSLCLSELQKLGKKWILIPNLITPEKLEPLLYRMGFEKIGSGFAAKLQ